MTLTMRELKTPQLEQNVTNNFENVDNIGDIQMLFYSTALKMNKLLNIQVGQHLQSQSLQWTA